MIDLHVKTIPNKKQRYPTIGDWFKKKGKDHIKISDMGNWKYETLVSIHEQIEYALCRSRGIYQSKVDRFDIRFERERASGKVNRYDEPGDDPRSPYFREHLFASKIECLLAQALNVDWLKYEDKVNSL